MAVDCSLKPTLAIYDFKPDPSGPSKRTHGTDDEVLLAFVEGRAEVAMALLRSGKTRRAFAVLRQLHLMTDGRGRAVAGEPYIPVEGLAHVFVRLQCSVAHSFIGQHVQALEEARAAKREMDEFWREVLQAFAQAEEAVSDGDHSKPPPPLKALLTNPPSWLPRAVEASVQARQGCVLEAEFLGPSFAESKDKWEEELQRLLGEGLSIAEQLLPERHATRVAAVRAVEQARQRHKRRQPVSSVMDSCSQAILPASVTNEDDSGVLPQTNPSVESSGDASPEKDQSDGGSWERSGSSTKALKASRLPALLSLTSRRRLPCGGMMSPSATCSTGFEGPDPTSPEGTTCSSGFVGISVRSASVPSLSPTSPPPGDLFEWALKRPRSSAGANGADVAVATESPGDSAAPRALPPDAPIQSQQNRSMTPSGSQKSPPGTAALRATGGRLNPFEDWRLNVVDFGRMTLRQHKLQSMQGISQLQDELRHGATKFKQLDIKIYNDDELWQNRTLFGEHATAVRRSSDKKKEKFRVSVRQGMEPAMEAERALYKRHGVDPGPSSYMAGYNSKRGAGAAQDARALRQLLSAPNRRTDRETAVEAIMELREKGIA